MEFIFVETQELKEFKKDLRRARKYFKKLGWQLVLGSFLIYIFTAFLIILLP